MRICLVNYLRTTDLHNCPTTQDPERRSLRLLQMGVGPGNQQLLCCVVWCSSSSMTASVSAAREIGRGCYCEYGTATALR